jgi:hypothetical protein
MKRVISFGDSFTAGLGTDRVEEDRIFNRARNKDVGRKKAGEFRTNNSFTKFFADKRHSDFCNRGEIGCSNKDILNNLMGFDRDENLSEDDFILIGFTSSYRDKLPFFPDVYNDNVKSGFQWCMKELSLLKMDKKNIFFWNSKLDKEYENNLNKFMMEYLKFYMVEVFDDSYWQIYNSNLIVYIQKYLEFKKVKYIMFDAFEPMLNDIPKFVNKKTYWECGEKNIHSFLKQFNDESVYEDMGHIINKLVPKHPSRKGHKLFTEELYRFYNEIY